MTDDREILDERARRLARPVGAAVETAGADTLFFSRGDEQLAIEVRYVLEIVPLPEVTPVPDLPAAFLGVVNHNGEILPVVDLGVLISGHAPGTDGRFLVIVGEHRRELGLAVSEVERLSVVAEWHPTDDDPLIRGVMGGNRVLIDGDVLLRDRRLFLTNESA